MVKKILEYLGLEAVAPPLVRARPDWSSWTGSEDADPYAPIVDEDWGRPIAPVSDTMAFLMLFFGLVISLD